MGHELLDVQAGFRKGRGTRDQIVNIVGLSKKQQSSRETSAAAAAAAAAAKSLQLCPTLCNPIDAAHQAPLPLGFSRQEHWSGLTFPSPMHESESEVAQLCPTQ